VQCLKLVPGDSFEDTERESLGFEPHLAEDAGLVTLG
jgi:hypothetical protein